MTAHTASHLLTRGAHRPRPGLNVLGEMTLAPGRVHEFCGPARRTLAAMVAARTEGEVFWIAPSWTLGGPHPDGLLRFLSPARMTFVSPRRPEDLFWCMEEVLRAGVVPLVIADLPAPPALTPVRRLHLAAETGGQASLGLILTPEGAAQGVESRWSLAPRHHGEEGEAWRLERLRARTAPRAAWTVAPGRGGYVAEAV